MNRAVVIRFLRTIRFPLFLILAAFVLIVFLRAPSFYSVPIMMYHHVEPLDRHEANWVSPERFEWHMQYLAEQGYHVISLAALVDLLEQGANLPAKSVVITFDDGCDDVYQYAFPVLKKYKFPATFFIPPADIGKEGIVTWNDLREMQQQGIAIESHGVTGEYLPDMPVDRQRREIVESKRTLELNMGRPISFFAYPIGGFSEEIKGMLKTAGYRAACATNRGFSRYQYDRFELKRIRFSNKDNSMSILGMKLSGYYNMFRKAKNPH